MTVLSIVRDAPDDEAPVRAEPELQLPSFEGETVEGLRAKLTSTSNLEVSEVHHRIDDTARLLVTGRVTRVDHVVEERSGKLLRVETFKIVEAVEVPWEAVADLLMDDTEGDDGE